MNEGDQSFSSYEGEPSRSILDDVQSMLVSEGDQKNSSEMMEMSSNEDDILEDISDNVLKEPEVEMNADFPNKAYADLMTLVTKHNLSNATGNSIIKFFNKHANLSKSPLPKSTEQGRKYMDKMNLPTLTFTKTSVINYKNNEYYLHHRSLINCVKNILSIPDISQNFALTFEKLKVIMNDATTQLIQLIYTVSFTKSLTLYNYSMMKKGHIVNKIPDYGGKMQKNPYQLALSFYL
jgi:hypothetical protein